LSIIHANSPINHYYELLFMKNITMSVLSSPFEKWTYCWATMINQYDMTTQPAFSTRINAFMWPTNRSLSLDGVITRQIISYTFQTTGTVLKDLLKQVSLETHHWNVHLCHCSIHNNCTNTTLTLKPWNLISSFVMTL